MERNKLGFGLAGVAVAALALGKIVRDNKNSIAALKHVNDRHVDNYDLLMHWLEVKNQGKSVADYFMEMGYHEVAVYGMAELANRLIEDVGGWCMLLMA